MSNAYLDGLREKFDAAQKNITDVQNRAVEESRDLTEPELRSVTELGAEAKRIAEQIAPLAEIETRAASVAKVTASFGATEVRTSNVTAQDRDPGHYRSESDGGKNSFFGDMFRAQKSGDRDAETRLAEHARAVTQASGGTGVVLPKWLTSEYQALARQQRAVASRVRHIDLGNDPRPLVLPKQTGGITNTELAVQSAEGANTAAWGTDKFTTNSDTLTPNTYAAYQDVSRQLLDSGSPAVDSLIFADLFGAWNARVEGLVCAAILAGGTAAGTTFADEAAFALNAAAIDGVIDAQTAVASDLRGQADLAIMNFRRFGAFRKLKDSTNRPLMPVTRYNPSNADGSLGNELVGDIEGVDVIASAGVPTAYAEKYAVLRSQAVILGESPVTQFTYDQVGGPSFVRMGIWAYLGILVRNPASVSIQTVTEADGES